MLIIIFSLFKDSREKNYKNSTIQQISISANQSVKWVKVVDISKNKFIQVPSVASNVRLSTLENVEVKNNSLTRDERIKLSKLSELNSKSEASLVLAESIKNKILEE